MAGMGGCGGHGSDCCLLLPPPWALGDLYLPETGLCTASTPACVAGMVSQHLLLILLLEASGCESYSRIFLYAKLSCPHSNIALTKYLP